MTDLLRASGFDAYSVAGGTQAWAASGRASERPVIPDLSDTPALTPDRLEGDLQMTDHTDLTIVPIETPTLGDRSYLVHDGEVAFVVDPQRDIDRVLDLLDEHGVRLTHVFETHIHNDYVTGGLALAQRTGAQYLVNGEDDVSFARTPVADGQVVEVGGRMRVTALATPGHTFTHLSYALTDAATGEQVGGVLRRLAAVRRHRAPRPARRTSTPTTWSGTSTPPRTGSPSSCPTRRRSSRRMGSGRSAPPPSPTPRPRPSGRRRSPTRC